MLDGDSTWADLARSVDAAQLFLDRGSAQKCAQHCAAFVEELKQIQIRARRLSRVEGMGTFPSGIALAQKFSLKASGGTYSMDQALADHIAEVQRMQQVFEKIEAMYGTAEESAVQGITSVGAGF